MTAALDRDERSTSAPIGPTRGTGGSARPAIRLAALRAPLAVKVIGAHVATLAIAGAVIGAQPVERMTASTLLLVGLGVTAIYVTLVVIALRPVRDLESAASRIWRGDYATRVDASTVADRNVLRVGSMFNLLLDGLASDRARLRLLANEVITAGDRERALLARELHDSTAQRLAALLLQVGSAARDSTDPVLQQRLFDLREEMHEVLEEVRVLAHTVHPHVLDDLGISAAIERLVRETERISELTIDVVVPRSVQVSPVVSSVLYRVAQEALRNVVRHAQASRASVVLSLDERDATIAITDDGHGFDVAAAERRHDGMGVFTMRERVELVDGTFSITSGSRLGTTVRASIPLAVASPIATRRSITGEQT